MSTAQSTVDFLTDHMRSAGNIRSKKMFGEYALYCNEKVVALVCDDQLYVKPTDAGRTMIDDPDEAPPYPGAKPYFLIGEEKWHDRDWLSALIRKTADALPASKQKKR